MARSAGSGVTAERAPGRRLVNYLGNGTPVPSFDPSLFVQGFVDHTTLTQINPIQSGVPILQKQHHRVCRLRLLAGFFHGY